MCLSQYWQDYHTASGGGKRPAPNELSALLGELTLFACRAVIRRYPYAQDHEGLAQEVVLAVWKRITAPYNFTNYNVFIAFVLSVANNICISQIRRDAVRPSRAIGASSAEPANSSQPVDSGDRPEETAVKRESAEVMNEVLNGLNRVDRRIVELRLKHQELTIADIAKQLGMSPRDVQASWNKSLVVLQDHRATQKLLRATGYLTPRPPKQGS